MPAILVFDVNETLLKMDVLEPYFQRVFGDGKVLMNWFNELIQYAMALTLTNSYKPFPEIARAALAMIAEVQQVNLSPDDSEEILGEMRRLPPHPEVADSLGRLKAAGFRLFTLTNSPTATLEAQMKAANIGQFFERNFSVDAVQRFKPAPEPYQMVARELRVEISDIRMVAAHAWDIGGAMRAGCQAAFVARQGKAPFPLFPPPDITGPTLREITEALTTG